MKPYIYLFTEDDGRVRQIVNGVVTSLNRIKRLPNAPIGSQDISILWQRDMNRWGQIRNFSLPLGFVTDGAIILRNDYYKFNIDRKLFLLIKRAVCEVDPVFFKSYYKHIYKGELDFSTFDDEQGNSRVNINIMEGGNSKLVKAQENTKVFIPFDDDAIDIQMDGILLTGKYNWVIPADQSLGIFVVGMYQLPSEQAAPGIAIFDVTQEPVTFADTDNAGKLYYFATSTQNIDNVVISGTMKYIQEGPSGGPLPNPSVTFTLSLQIFNSESNTPRLTIDLAPADPYQSTQDIPFTTTVSLIKGDRLFLKKIGRFRESSIKMELQSKKPPTTIKAFKPFDLWKKLLINAGVKVEKIKSDLLKACTFCVTSGDAIRGLPNVGVSTSINDFIKAFDVYLFAGVQIKDTVEMEGRETYFVKDSVDPAVELGKSKNMKVTAAVDLMYSSIKIGHQEQDIQDLNGKYDFNGWHTYSTPIKRVSKELDLQSPYKAGPYEIEIARINFEGKTTTDSTHDNNVFVIDVKFTNNKYENIVCSFIAPNILVTDPAIPLFVGQTIRITNDAFNNGDYTISSVSILGAQFVGLTGGAITSESNVPITLQILTGIVNLLDRSVIPDSGVPSPTTIFNVRLRVSALFEKHYRWIRSWLYGYDNEEINFKDANRNKELVVTGLSDIRDVAIAEMGDRIFIPDYLESEDTVPVDLNDILDTTPNKSFAINWKNNRFTGFLITGGLAPNSRKEQTFKLLSSIENDRLWLTQ